MQLYHQATAEYENSNQERVVCIASRRPHININNAIHEQVEQQSTQNIALWHTLRCHKGQRGLITTVGSNEHIVIFEDLNARIGNEEMPGVKHRFNEAVINENGKLLIHFCARYEKSINNSFFSYKNQHKYKFNNTRGLRSTIDFIITNRAITSSQILLERPQTAKTTPVYIEKYNTESLASESTRILFESRLTNKLEGCNMALDWDVEGHWLNIKTCIEQAAEEAIGKRKININANNRTKPWFCQEVKQLADLKRSSYLKYMSLQTIEQAEYVQTRNKKLLKNRKKSVNEYAPIKGVYMETWEEYFRQLCKFEETGNLEEHQTVSNTTIQESDIELRLKKVKNKKAPGPDNTLNELLKYSGQELTRQRCLLFNNILRTAQIPQDWLQFITIPIFKKGQNTCPDNYSRITLLCTTMKLFTGILKNKLGHIENREEQQGFRRNRSRTHAIFSNSQTNEIKGYIIHHLGLYVLDRSDQGV
ncbi:hypothetical protein HUJ04_000468 [Dendroctonus ponderosae]|nr:hypothetical protein HUJ04_000468 [Dendroctonus ponderosae]